MSLLEMKNIKKNFNGVEVLKDISLKVEKGEIHALVGENGAGKSTLLSLVCADNPQSYACDISLSDEREEQERVFGK